MELCPTCGSVGFEESILGPHRCTFCDGSEGGNPPDPLPYVQVPTCTSNIGLRIEFCKDLNCPVHGVRNRSW
jgi:hypothetical protein